MQVFMFCKKKKSAHFKHTFFYCIFSQYLQQMQISLEQRIKDCLYMYQRSCTKLNRPPKWMTHPTNKTTTTPTMTNHYIRHISYLSSSYHQHRLQSSQLSLLSSLSVVEAANQREDKKVYEKEGRRHRMVDLLRHIMKLMSSIFLPIYYFSDKAMEGCTSTQTKQRQRKVNIQRFPRCKISNSSK